MTLLEDQSWMTCAAERSFSTPSATHDLSQGETCHRIRPRGNRGSSHYWHATRSIARALPKRRCTHTMRVRAAAGEGKRRKPPQSKKMRASRKAKLAAARRISVRYRKVSIHKAL